MIAFSQKYYSHLDEFQHQYNEDKEEIESWNQIVSIFEGVLDTFYTKLEEAKSKQPTPDW